ncbi:MAG: hypothetical protein IKO61_02820 [Lachnospiraceae bacterium]|nr:hypothetical protein [Lachnospiraceae bacterium]
MEYKLFDANDKDIPEGAEPDLIYFGEFEDGACKAYAAFKRSEDDPEEVSYLGSSVTGKEEQDLLAEAEEFLSDMGIRYVRITMVGTLEEVAPEYYRLKYDGYTPISLNERIYDEEKGAYVQEWIKSLD